MSTYVPRWYALAIIEAGKRIEREGRNANGTGWLDQLEKMPGYKENHNRLFPCEIGDKPSSSK